MNRVLLFLPLAVGCAQLGLVCTEMGCVGTLTVTLSRALADDAVVTVDLDGEVLDCPVDPEGGQPTTGCEVRTEDAGQVLRVSSGSTAWEEVVVSVSEGGAAAVDHVLTPEWGERFYPNGKACDGPDGGCVSGEADLDLD